jgi:hypothetical protein
VVVAVVMEVCGGVWSVVVVVVAVGGACEWCWDGGHNLERNDAYILAGPVRGHPPLRHAYPARIHPSSYPTLPDPRRSHPSDKAPRALIISRYSSSPSLLPLPPHSSPSFLLRVPPHGMSRPGEPACGWPCGRTAARPR